MAKSKKPTTQTPKKLDFMKYRWLYYLISALVIIPGIVSLILFGLKPAIDFTGGTLLEIKVPQESELSESSIKALALPEVTVVSVQSSGEDHWVIRTKPITKDQNDIFKQKLASHSATLEASPSAEASASATIEELRFETVGPTLGQELVRKTIASVILAALAIMLYVAYRFKELKYGVCAILAMFHDTLILLGTFSLLGHFYGIEIDALFVTAILTTLSFSVHDTIVVYDRIRENSRNHPKASFYDIVNKSVAETLSRSINNSMTIIFMLLALWLFGGESIRWFVFALLIGTIAGTYSSTFTAAPLLIEWERIRKKLNR